MAAAVLLTDGVGRALLVEPICKPYWEIVGGCVEVDESPRRAAAREGARPAVAPGAPGGPGAGARTGAAVDGDDGDAGRRETAKGWGC